MKRAGILGLAIVLTVAFGVGATAAAKKAKKVETEIEIEGTEFVQPATLVYFGDVHAKKSKCERNRHVTLYYDTEDGPGENFQPVGEDTTDHTGDFEVEQGLIGDDAYYAVVDKKRVGRGDKKVVCKAAESELFFLVA